MSNIKIFYHIYCIEPTEKFVKDQINKIIFSGLYHKVKAIYCFLVGETKFIESIKTLLTLHGKKFIIASIGYGSITYKQILELNKNVVIPNTEEWLMYEGNNNPHERTTLLQIKKFIKPNDKILYIHSKGVTRSNHDHHAIKCILDWRNCMEYWLIYNHEQCIKLLDEYDTVGINHIMLPKPHYSGNFWWTTAKYYNTLSDTIDYSDHINPELYICTGNPNAKCIHNTGLQSKLPYITPCPMSLFIDL